MGYRSSFRVPPMTAVISVAAILGSIGVAWADMNGRELQLTCRFYPSAIHSTAVCLAYIDGNLEMLRALNKGKKAKKTCEPATGADELFHATFIEYLNTNINERHLDATALLLKVYEATFACK